MNPIAWKARAGYLKDYIPLPLPLIPGWDVAGVVEAVGAGVTKFKKGDEVYARPNITHDGYGGYAEYVVAKEAEAALKPKSIDHVQAANGSSRGGDGVAGAVRHCRVGERTKGADSRGSRRPSAALRCNLRNARERTS